MRLYRRRNSMPIAVLMKGDNPPFLLRFSTFTTTTTATSSNNDDDTISISPPADYNVYSSITPDPSLVDATNAPPDFEPACAVVYRDVVTSVEADLISNEILTRMKR
jgi:hypothetical protein